MKIFYSRPKQDSKEYLPDMSATKETMTAIAENEIKKPLDGPCSPGRWFEKKLAARKFGPQSQANRI